MRKKNAVPVYIYVHTHLYIYIYIQAIWLDVMTSAITPWPIIRFSGEKEGEREKERGKQ
jgi:hypothetical protein